MESTHPAQQVWRMAMSALIFAVILTVLASATPPGVSGQILALMVFLVFLLGCSRAGLICQAMHRTFDGEVTPGISAPGSAATGPSKQRVRRVST